jgi:hypothetical protein
MPKIPKLPGVMRVDNYTCQSTFWRSKRGHLKPHASIPSKLTPIIEKDLFTLPTRSVVDEVGMKFVTIFCDDQKVPLPAMVVDVLSHQGEKVTKLII